MITRRVLLFSTQRLFGESVEQTLSQVEGLEICGHWPLDDLVMERLTAGLPDCVIFIDDSSVEDLLFNLTAQILDHYPDLPVFRVTLERSHMQIFNSQLVPARSAELIDLIQHLPLKRAGAE